MATMPALDAFYFSTERGKATVETAWSSSNHLYDRSAKISPAHDKYQIPFRSFILAFDNLNYKTPASHRVENAMHKRPLFFTCDTSSNPTNDESPDRNTPSPSSTSRSNNAPPTSNSPRTPPPTPRVPAISYSRSSANRTPRTACSSPPPRSSTDAPRPPRGSGGNPRIPVRIPVSSCRGRDRTRPFPWIRSRCRPRADP
mmetsp:Transcript_13035/g.28161  ORF Transcript_13035/g.28161 Transcript_13035/m.28161 type:complete len:200 (+) Transcript_13035:230-829(+)